MKPFLFLWMILCVFSLQKYPTIIATNTYSVPEPDLPLHKFSGYQEKLVNALESQITEVLKTLNAPEFSLTDEDFPAVQNVTNIVGGDLLDGNLYMYNTAILGLTENEDDIDVDVVRDESEIRMKVKLKQLKIQGEYAYDYIKDDTEQKGTFSVALTNVVIKGVASLLDDPNGNMVVSKVVPTILSEDTHVTVKPRVVPSTPIMESALEHLRNNILKRFGRIAYLEVLMHYPKKSVSSSIPKINSTIFEARKFVSQRYDPFIIKRVSMNDSPQSWQLGPFRLHGHANFHLEEADMIITNTSVNIIFRIISDSLWARFPFTLQKKYVGEYTAEKMDFIGRIKLMADNSQTVPIMDGLGLEMADCKTTIRNKATGAQVGSSEFGFDANDLFCLLVRNEISTSNIIRTVQSEIFNRIELAPLQDAIKSVIYEDRLLTEAY